MEVKLHLWLPDDGEKVSTVEMPEIPGKGWPDVVIYDKHVYFYDARNCEYHSATQYNFDNKKWDQT